MDPEVTWKLFWEACEDWDLPLAEESLGNLYKWVWDGGKPPEGLTLSQIQSLYLWVHAAYMKHGYTKLGGVTNEIQTKG